jgi:large subunit ribosomal protein L35
LPFSPGSAIKPPFRRPAEQGLPWRRRCSPAIRSSRALLTAPPEPLVRLVGRSQEKSKMPKIKTKSGAKKRFKVTGSGKVLFAQSGKRHGMIKRSTKQIRDHRGTKVMFKTDGERIKKYWMPNG